MHKIGILFFALLLIFFIDGAYAQTSEEIKIECLIASISKMPEGIKFIRNGKAHSREEAADHLRTKYRRGKKYAATAKLFIENIASKSSLSRTEYSIRFVDGKTVTTHEFFTEELKRIEKRTPLTKGCL
ncbi:MAG: DUF5329 domain-containing protein [Azoarcus sp.]|jgi:hypothetical protein|nr:DUF5329 domain-containing protein [Azoarcus sp.]